MKITIKQIKLKIKYPQLILKIIKLIILHRILKKMNYNLLKTNKI